MANLILNDTEIAQLVNEVDMYELAEKTINKIDLTDDESTAVSLLDKRFKEIGKSGCDPDHEVAAFISRVVNEEMYDAPNELLDRIFDRDTIGEFDDYDAYTTPKNTLVAYEAAKGGNVLRSYLDIAPLRPQWKNFQIEAGLTYADLRKNGWKSVALLTDCAVRAFDNKVFAAVFGAIDNAIPSGAANYIAETNAMPTQATMDAVALYLNDRDGGVITALSKYIQAASKLNTGYISNDMKNEVHRTGFLSMYDGNPMMGVSGAHKLGNGDLLIADKRIFGIAGKVGTLTTKGEINIYQDMNNNREEIHLLFKDYTVGWAFNNTALDNIVKVELA